MQMAEGIILAADLRGMTLEELNRQLNTTMVATKKAVAESKHIVSIDGKLVHDEAFVDWDEGAQQMENILEKLLDKNNGYVSNNQWTAITEVDTKKKPGRRITRHYAALLRISNGVRPYFISIRS